MWQRMNALISGETPMRTVRTGDGEDDVKQVPVTAWYILQHRNGWEYENYQLELVN